MIWASVDGAKAVSGVAVWDGQELLATHVVKGLAWGSWRGILEGAEGLVIEEGYVGKSRKTGMVLAFARGVITAYAEVQGARLLASYQPSSWRKLVGIPPAAMRKVQKQAAAAMCRWLSTPPAERPRARPGSVWGSVYLPTLADATTDECEAALIGLAHLRKVEQ